MPSSVNHLFDQIHKLPQIPEVVREIINQLNNPNVLLLDLGKNVAKEQVLSLKILRLVNSAHFGLSRKVASVDEAIALIGMDKLKTLVIASGLVSSMPAVPHFDIKKFWCDSFQAATLAKWFAQHNEQPADVAYTAALLRNLGSLLIAIAAPRESNEIEQHVKAGADRSETEKRRLGYTGVEVSAELCRRWKFAETLTETIEQSADPTQLTNPQPLACTVYLAALVAQSIETHDAAAIMNSVSQQLLNASGFKDDFLAEHLNEVITLQSNMEALLD